MVQWPYNKKVRVFARTSNQSTYRLNTNLYYTKTYTQHWQQSCAAFADLLTNSQCNTAYW
jgi:chloramphenicol O-acetyltransferase